MRKVSVIRLMLLTAWGIAGRNPLYLKACQKYNPQHMQRFTAQSQVDAGYPSPIFLSAPLFCVRCLRQREGSK